MSRMASGFYPRGVCWLAAGWGARIEPTTMDTGLILLLVAATGVVRGSMLVLQLLKRTVSVPQLNGVIIKYIQAGELERAQKILSAVDDAPYARALVQVLEGWSSGASAKALVEAFNHEREQHEPWAKAALSRSVFAGAVGVGPVAYSLAQGLPIGTCRYED